eukprot:6866375-Pyramimonas_sp.AAC.1
MTAVLRSCFQKVRCWDAVSLSILEALLAMAMSSSVALGSRPANVDATPDTSGRVSFPTQFRR